MPSANVYDMDGQVVREESLDDYVFGAPVNTAVLHQVVTAQFVNRRQGTAYTKTRAEVSGGNKKPYRQKGTGPRPPGFDTRAALAWRWRGLWAASASLRARDPAQDEAHLAIRSALSDKAANGRILLMESLTFEEPRTGHGDLARQAARSTGMVLIAACQSATRT